MKMDGAEEQFFIDSKPIEVCRVAKEVSVAKWDVPVNSLKLLILVFVLLKTLIIMAISCTQSVDTMG